MVPVVTEHLDVIRELCVRNGVKRLFLFGPAATGAFDRAGDVPEFAVEFEPDAPDDGWGGPRAALREDMKSVFGPGFRLAQMELVRNPYVIASFNSTKVLLYPP